MINYDDVRTELTAGKALPHFASQSGSSIREMESGLQQLGFEPLKTLPAQYHNWLLKRSTDQERNSADCLDSVVQELNALLEEFNVTPTDALKNQIITLLKTNYPQEFLSTVFLKLTGGTIDGNLHIKGDLSVDGIGEEIISTELKVGADTITLRNGNPTAMSAHELAGVITENYDGNGKNNILAIAANGNARVGDIDIATRLLYSNDGTNFYEDEDLTISATIGQDEIVRDTGNTTSGGVKIYEGTTFSNDDTEAIATREDNPAAGGYAKWNDGAKRFDAVVPDAMPTANSQNLATSGGIFDALAAASNNFILTAQGAADAQKTIDLPGGQISEGQTVTVNFKNGHAMIYNNPMRLNNILVVSNQNGTLAPIPLHAMTEGGQTVYKVLDPNTILSVYYTADYDGNETPAWVIVGNPLVLSSSTYSIYANGQIGNEQVATVRSILSNNVPYGWLLCDATVRNKADYPKLWDEIPPIFKNTANNTFVIDLREAALKGTGLTSKSSAHYNSTGLTLGQFIEDRFQGHHHKFGCFGGARGTYAQQDTVDLINWEQVDRYSLVRVLEPITGTNGNVRYGDTTEVKAVGVNWIIKAM